MKRIDILVCLELFNIRKQKCYPKQVIKDSYDVIRRICSKKYSIFSHDEPIDNFEKFKNALRSHYLERSSLEYRYCQELLDYLTSFERFVVSDLY